MRLRAALATLTAVLLLTISCAASACAASCAAMALGSGCSGSASHTNASVELSGHQMYGMSHRVMTGPKGIANLAMVMPSSSSCIQHVCELTPTLLRSDYGGVQLLVAIQPMSLSTQAIFTPETEPQIEAVGTPPLRSRLVVALQTTLRI